MAIRPTQPSAPLAVSILPLESKDYPIVASLEAEVFKDDPISVYAFGPLRDSPAELEKRVAMLGKPAVGCVVRMRKAVTKEGRTVGFAFWKFLEDGYDKPSGDQNEEVQHENIEGADEVNMAERVDESEKEEQPRQSRWPEGADVEFCEAVFGKSDELREAMFKGQRHVVLNILIVHPEYQGRGIGSALIRDGIAEADRQRMRVWLGATEEGLRLYKKVGFEVDEVLEFDMRRFGLEDVEKHTIMIRPAMRA